MYSTPQIIMERLSFYTIAVSSAYIFLEVRKEDDLRNILILFDLFIRKRRDAQFQIITKWHTSSSEA